MKMNSNSNLVPFGKYKGQPVEVVQETDPKYIEWLAAQDFVKQRFGNFYQVIINNCQASDDTPEHNKIQTLFLDDEICANTVMYMNPSLKTIFRSAINQEVEWRQREIIDGCDDFDRKYEQSEIDKMQSEIDILHKQEKPIAWTSIKFQREFEPKGSDIKLTYDINYLIANQINYGKHGEFYIECKPSISDDYPAVYRQIKASGIPLFRILLVIGEFTAKGCTQDQFVKMAPCKVAFLFDLLKKEPKLSETQL